ncbi:hypothetical protein PIB30_101374, partial [Stylosanthes scabra]|nr:hypothetical protein [Stylosanthes scabra]
MIQSHTRPRLCVDRVTPDHAYTWIESQPDHTYAWWISHPRICVENTLAASTRPTHRRESPRICVESSPKAMLQRERRIQNYWGPISRAPKKTLTRSLVFLLLGPLLTWSTLIITPRTSLVTHSLAPTHLNPMLPRHSYP